MSSPNLSVAQIQETWEAVLGHPSREPYIDPRSPMPIVLETLANAYAGPNSHLGTRIDSDIRRINMWALQIVAPIVELEQSMSATWVTMSFLPALLEHNPPGAVPRSLTYKSETFTSFMDRSGVGLEMELEFASSEQGIRVFAQKVTQIARSVTESARADVIATLMHAEDRPDAFRRKYGDGVTPLQVENYLNDEVTWWCFLQQMENGPERYRERVRRLVECDQTIPELNVMITDITAAGYMKVVPQSAVQHRFAGDLAMANIANMAIKGYAPTRYSEDAAIPAFLENEGTMVFFARPVPTSDQGCLDLMERHAQIGEYVTMCLDPSEVDDSYRSSHRNTQIYNEGADTMYKLTQRWFLDNCHLFNGDGAPRGCAHEGNDFKSIPGNNNSEIPIPWFLSDETIPHHTFGAALKKHPTDLKAMGVTAAADFVRSYGVSPGKFADAVSYLRQLHEMPIQTGYNFATIADSGAMAVANEGITAGLTTADFDADMAMFNNPLKGSGDTKRIVNARNVYDLLFTTGGNDTTRGGTPTYGFLVWAAAEHLDPSEKAKAIATLDVLRSLVYWISSRVPDFPAFKNDSAIPYLLSADPSAIEKKAQSLVEVILGNVQGMVVVNYGTAVAAAANTGPNTILASVDLEITSNTAFAAALGEDVRRGRALEVKRLLFAIKNLTGTSDANFAAFIATTTPQLQRFVNTDAIRVEDIRTFMEQVERLYVQPTRSAAEAEQRTNSKIIMERTIRGLARISNDPAEPLQTRDSITTVNYLPLVWPNSGSKKPIKLRNNSWVYPTLSHDPMMIDLAHDGDAAHVPQPIQGRVRAAGKYPIGSKMNCGPLRIGARYRQLQTRLASTLVGMDVHQFHGGGAELLPLDDEMDEIYNINDVMSLVVTEAEFTLKNCREFDANNIYLPFQPIIARPFATYLTGTVINTRAGISDMAVGSTPTNVTTVGKTTVTIGVNPATQMMGGSVNTYFKAVNTMSKAVVKGFNAYTKDALGGLGIKVIDPDNQLDYDVWDAAHSGDILVIPEGPQFIEHPFLYRRFDITGRYFLLMNRGFAPMDATTRDDGFHYSCCAWVVERYNLISLLKNPYDGPTSVSVGGPGVAANTVCWGGLQVGMSSDGKYDQVTQGVGHWGANQGPGNRAVRKGQLKRPRHHGMSLGMEASGSLMNGQ